MPDRTDREYQSRVRRNRQKKVKPPAGVKGPVKPRPKPAPSPEDTRTPRQPRLTRQEKREIEEITGTLSGAVTRGSRKVQRSGERFVGTVGALAVHEARLRAIAAFQKMGLEGSKPYNLSEILHGTRKVTDTIPAVGEALGRGAFDLGKKQVAEGGIPRALKHNLWDDQRGTLGYLSGDWFAQSKNQERVAEATMGKAAANLLYHGDRSHPIAASLEIGSMFPVFKWAKVVTDIARGGKRAKQAAEVVAPSVERRFIDLQKKVVKAERRVEREYGSVPPELQAQFELGDRRDWVAWSRARGYTEDEIADYRAWRELNAEHPGLKPDMRVGDKAYVSREGIREHLAPLPPAAVEIPPVLLSGTPLGAARRSDTKG